MDGNFERLSYYAGDWAAGTYTAYEVVQHEGGTWMALATTTAEPGSNIAEWLPIGIVPGRGGMVKTPDTAGTDIGAGWQTLTYNALTIGTYGVTLTPASGTFNTTWPGLWELRVLFSMSHDEQNTGRSTNIRLWNVTDGAQVGASVYVPIGRNQPGTLVPGFLNLDVAAADLGDDIRVEIGGGDTIAGITWHTSRLELTQLSPPVT
jgi:hypothetical protein